MTRDSGINCQLIHDPTWNPCPLMFCSLTQKSTFGLGELKAEDPFHHQSGCRFESCTAAEPCPQGKVRFKPNVEPGNRMTGVSILCYYSKGVVRPRFVTREGHLMFERNHEVTMALRTRQPHLGAPIGLSCGLHVAVDCCRHHDAPLVINVLTNKIYPPRRSRSYNATRLGPQGRELARRNRHR